VQQDPALQRIKEVPVPVVDDDSWAERMARQVEEAESKREEAKVYQLAFWADDKRAMPHDFIACALFAAIQDKDARYLAGEEIASANGLRITFRGQRLTQVHADVWQGIMHLARGQTQGNRVRFRARQLLRLIGRQMGKAQRAHLMQWLSELTATNSDENTCSVLCAASAPTLGEPVALLAAAS